MPPEPNVEDIVTRLRFDGRYASETDAERATRKNRERREAATVIETLRNEIKELEFLRHSAGGTLAGEDS